MRSTSIRAVRPLLVLAALALGACGERASPTQPTPQSQSALITCQFDCGTGGGGGGTTTPPPPSITSVSMQSTTLDLAGTAVSYSVSLKNEGSSRTNVSVEGTVIQGSASRSTGNESVFCGLTVGTLPTGTCNDSFSASVSNSTAGPGTLTTGAAILRISLFQGFTLLATRDVNITLVSTIPEITNLQWFASSLIGGSNRTFVANISNPGSTRTGVSYQAYIRQFTTIRAAGNAPIECGSGAGVLPTGTCTNLGSYSASNTAEGSGTLVPGTAELVVELRSASGTVLHTRSVTVTLAALPTITALTPPASATIGGSAGSYTATVQNSGPSIAGVTARATITQGTTVSRAAGTSSIGTLPNGAFTFTGTVTASNSAAGTGTLAPGSATLTVELIDAASNVLATRTATITLVAATPRISNTSLSATDLVIEDFSQTYSLTLDNPGPSLPNVTLLVFITQGAATEQGAGGQTVACGPGGADGLPTGTCTVSGSILVTNSGGGTGTLAPGAAALEFRLFDGDSGTLLDTKSVNVNLLAGLVGPPSGD